VLFTHLNKSIVSCVDWDVCNLVENTLFCLDVNVVCQVLLHILEIQLYSDAGIGRLHSAFSEVISYCWTCLVVFTWYRTFEWQRRILLMWRLTGARTGTPERGCIARALLPALWKGGNRGTGALTHCSIISNFMIYQHQFEKNLLQLFAHT